MPTLDLAGPHDPQVHTAVNLSAQQEVSRGNARGILVARARKGAVVGRFDHTNPLASKWVWDERPGRPSRDRILTSPDSAEWLDYTK